MHWSRLPFLNVKVWAHLMKDKEIANPMWRFQFVIQTVIFVKLNPIILPLKAVENCNCMELKENFIRNSISPGWQGTRLVMILCCALSLLLGPALPVCHTKPPLRWVHLPCLGPPGWQIWKRLEIRKSHKHKSKRIMTLFLNLLQRVTANLPDEKVNTEFSLC